MPYKNFITEVLSAHADKLSRKDPGEADYAHLFPNNRDLPSLLILATQVKSALEPVTPPASFTDRLHQDLITAAQVRQRARQPSASALMPAPIVISSVAGGLLALVGIFFFVRNQMQQKTTS